MVCKDDPPEMQRASFNRQMARLLAERRDRENPPPPAPPVEGTGKPNSGTG
ncbi:MAG: hypothetical protein PHU85_02175 [Phycisphaerae bacterium]|nr:hypothetical protein [Phycisphaerae bacterium]